MQTTNEVTTTGYANRPFRVCRDLLHQGTPFLPDENYHATITAFAPDGNIAEGILRKLPFTTFITFIAESQPALIGVDEETIRGALMSSALAEDRRITNVLYGEQSEALTDKARSECVFTLTILGQFMNKLTELPTHAPDVSKK
jgi:hypothetical protein